VSDVLPTTPCYKDGPGYDDVFLLRFVLTWEKKGGLKESAPALRECIKCSPIPPLLRLRVPAPRASPPWGSKGEKGGPWRRCMLPDAGTRPHRCRLVPEGPRTQMMTAPCLSRFRTENMAVLDRTCETGERRRRPQARGAAAPRKRS